MTRACLLLLSTMFAISVLPVWAAGENGHAAPKAAGGGEAKKGGAPGTNVEMPFLMAPVTDADGTLTGYAYVSSRMTATSDSAVLAVRDKIPFIQDAFVRDVNAQPITQAGHPDTVDIPGLEARLLADAQRVMGAGKVKTFTVCTVQMAELKAKPAPGRAAGESDAPAEKSRCAN